MVGALGLFMPAAWATPDPTQLPTGGLSPTAAITASGANMTVDGKAANNVIAWDSFSIGENAAVNFNDGRDCGIESVSILVASVAVTVESSTYQAARAGLYSSDATEASYAKDYKSDEVYKVNVRVKRVPCTIRENRYAVIPSLSANDIPEAFGGVRIDIENPFVRASHSMGGMGPYVSPPSEQLESKSTLKLKAFCGYGPVLVKFKPNTSVKE